MPLRDAPAQALESRPKKTFGLLLMVLFSASAVLVGDTVASSAAMGVSGLTFWVVLGVLFFLPYGLVTAELGAAWPDEGGIYVWVREAFGPVWGTMAAWLYWVNVAFWAPSVFVLLIGTFQSVFAPAMSRTQQMWAVLAFIWVMVGVGVLPLRFSKWVPDLSAALAHRARRRCVRGASRTRQLVLGHAVDPRLESERHLSSHHRVQLHGLRTDERRWR